MGVAKRNLAAPQSLLEVLVHWHGTRLAAHYVRPGQSFFVVRAGDGAATTLPALALGDDGLPVASPSRLPLVRWEKGGWRMSPPDLTGLPDANVTCDAVPDAGATPYRAATPCTDHRRAPARDSCGVVARDEPRVWTTGSLQVTAKLVEPAHSATPRRPADAGMLAALAVAVLYVGGGLGLAVAIEAEPRVFDNDERSVPLCCVMTQERSAVAPATAARSWATTESDPLSPEAGLDARDGTEPRIMRRHSRGCSLCRRASVPARRRVRIPSASRQARRAPGAAATAERPAALANSQADARRQVGPDEDRQGAAAASSVRPLTGATIVDAELLDDSAARTSSCGLGHFRDWMPYRVVRVVRGADPGPRITVLHGCAEMSRAQYGGAAAGNVRSFVAGEVHRIVLGAQLPDPAGDQTGPLRFTPERTDYAPRDAL